MEKVSNDDGRWIVVAIQKNMKNVERNERTRKRARKRDFICVQKFSINFKNFKLLFVIAIELDTHRYTNFVSSMMGCTVLSMLFVLTYLQNAAKRKNPTKKNTYNEIKKHIMLLLRTRSIFMQTARLHESASLGIFRSRRSVETEIISCSSSR